MKKISALALALMMALSLAACGGNEETPSGSGTTDPSTSQQHGSTPDDGKTGSNELFDVTDGQITVNDGMNAADIPAVMKKGIGTLKSDGFKYKKINAALAGTYSAEINIALFDVTEEDYNTLLAYYEAEGGAAEEDPFMKGSYEVVFDWGKLTMDWHADYNQITVVGYISE